MVSSDRKFFLNVRFMAFKADLSGKHLDHDVCWRQLGSLRHNPKGWIRTQWNAPHGDRRHAQPIFQSIDWSPLQGIKSVPELSAHAPNGVLIPEFARMLVIHTQIHGF